MLFVLVFQIRQNIRSHKTKVNGSRRMAWAFTSLSGYGVWRYQEYVDEVRSPRFFCIQFKLIVKTLTKLLL